MQVANPGAPAATCRGSESLRPAIDADALSRRFNGLEALRGVSLRVAPGEVHALLGPNGAGKTTLIRVLTGLADPSGGTARVLGRPVGRRREWRGAVGLVPSGDRSFYLRISALENLVFFGRLNGMRRAAARSRATEVLEAVGLADAAHRRVGVYSHGMQKRLSFARALLCEPRVLLVDEATHDLDPAAARQIRRLTRGEAGRGSAILWATQRIEELPGFADRVTLLDRGAVRFAGSVSSLAAVARADRHVLRLGDADTRRLPVLSDALGACGRLEQMPDGDSRDAVLELASGVPLSTAIAALARAGAEVVSCHEERSPIERAFLSLTEEEAA